MTLNHKYFNLYLNKNYLFERNPSIAVAVSGGPDSMALLFLLKKWIDLNKGFLIALIVDHQIRKDSNEEASKVKKYLSLFKIDSKILKVSKKNILKKNMKEARDNRFNKLIDYCYKNKILHLFIGQHYDDNIETFLLRKLAGSNYEGLQGMQSKLSNKRLQIIRPLLNFNKKDLVNFNKSHNINFVIDPSNTNLKYSRVAIREFLINYSEFKTNIEEDFKVIIKDYAYYKKMIFNIMNNLTLTLKKELIIVETSKFLQEDIEIQSKITEILFKYLRPNKALRSKKIYIMLKSLKNNSNYTTNFSGICIKKDNFMINFTL